jgi:hypothetical protein
MRLLRLFVSQACCTTSRAPSKNSTTETRNPHLQWDARKRTQTHAKMHRYHNCMHAADVCSSTEVSAPFHPPASTAPSGLYSGVLSGCRPPASAVPSACPLLFPAPSRQRELKERSGDFGTRVVFAVPAELFGHRRLRRQPPTQANKPTCQRTKIAFGEPMR